MRPRGAGELRVRPTLAPSLASYNLRSSFDARAWAPGRVGPGIAAAVRRGAPAGHSGLDGSADSLMDTLFLVLLLHTASVSALASPPLASASALSLVAALERAEAHNARLPVAALDTRIAEARHREAEAGRRLKLGVEGDLIVAPANGYDPVVTNLGEERLQVVAEHPLLDGGALAAATRQARAEIAVAAARYRQAAGDVEREVRESYAAIVAAEVETVARRESLERLRRYRLLLEDRHRSGQGVAADLLSTAVGLATDESALVEAESRRDEAQAKLDSLMGEPPEAPLQVAGLEPLGSPPAIDSGQAVRAPEVQAAAQAVESARAALAAAQAERRPQLGARADAGLWGSDTTDLAPPDLGSGGTFADRLRRDFGYSLSLSFSWPAFRSPAIAARIAQAELRLEQAQATLKLEETNARLELAQASAAMARTYEQHRLLAAAAPAARDAYLDAESRYFGGAATYLEVLDAFAAAVDVAVQEAQVELAYRTAEARARRFGGGPP